MQKYELKSSTRGLKEMVLQNVSSAIDLDGRPLQPSARHCSLNISLLNMLNLLRLACSKYRRLRK